MAKKHKMPAAHGNEVNVTPLIDVIMCLIIFFMLVTKIGVATGAKAQVKLPEAYLGKKIDDMGSMLTLNIIPTGDLAAIEADEKVATEMQVSALVDGVDKDLPRDVVQNGVRKNILLETLQMMKKRYGDKFQVIIRAHSKLPFTLIEPVLTDCAKAGVGTQNFSIKNGSGAGPAAPAEAAK